MNVLEKIFEEIIDELKEDGVIADNERGHRAIEIIRSHMDEAKDINVPSNDDMEEKIREHIAECLHRIDNIRSFIGSKEYTNNDEKCIRNIEVLKTIITALEIYLSSKKKSGNDDWIPVEERLPEEKTEVLCCFEDGTVQSLWQNWKNDGLGDYLDDDLMQTELIAWQPLPEPYKPKEKNNE